MDYVAFGGAANAVTGGQNNPVYAVAAINKSIPGLTAQAWFYQAVNVLNAWYFQGDYKYQVNKEIGLFAGAQFLNEGGVGNTQSSFKNGVGGSGTSNMLLAYCDGQNNSTTCSSGISSNYFAFKVGGSYEDLTLTAAYSNTSYNANAAMDGSLIMPWGGSTTTLFTSMMLASATAAGTQATQFKAEYKISDGLLKGLYAQAAYTLYAAKSAATDAYTSGNSFGYSATSSIGGNQGYSAAYGELKYDINKQTSIRWRVESDNMIGQCNGLPKTVVESRLMGIYKF